MNLNNVDINELIAREGGRVLYSSPNGVIVRQADDDATVMSNIEQPEELCAAICATGLSDARIFSLKNVVAANAVCKAFGLNHKTCCSQWVYEKRECLEGDFSNIKQLGTEYIDTVNSIYGIVDNREYITQRIEERKMWGLFENGNLAGFIGIHSEGSIGMLEIMPDYRRKGYGYLLEAYVLIIHINNGWTPYCHVIDGNTASISLQQKLGYTKAELPAVWVSRK